MSRERKPNTRITFAEGRIIDGLIRKHATIHGNGPIKERRVEYNPQWDDARVAEEASKEAGIPISLPSLRRFRQLYIGALSRGGWKGSSSSPSGRGTPILTTVTLLRRQNALLEERIAAMEEYLRAGGYTPPIPEYPSTPNAEIEEAVE